MTYNFTIIAIPRTDDLLDEFSIHDAHTMCFLQNTQYSYGACPSSTVVQNGFQDAIDSQFLELKGFNEVKIAYSTDYSYEKRR